MSSATRNSAAAARAMWPTMRQTLRPTLRPIFLLMIVLAAVWPAAAHAEPQAPQHPTAGSCGLIWNNNHYGPYDYRTDHERLVVVEKYHFASYVEGLVRGQSGYLDGDLNYVLKAAPNHHRALVAVTRLSERMKSDKLPNMDYSIDCFYVRAVIFAPDDLIVRALYARYLDKHSRKKDAKKQLETAIQLAKDDPFSHYNIGLVYFEIGEYESALAQAWQAKSLGFERPELVQMLKDANKWRDPPAEGSAAASAAAGASSAAPAASSP